MHLTLTDIEDRSSLGIETTLHSPPVKTTQDSRLNRRIYTPMNCLSLISMLRVPYAEPCIPEAVVMHIVSYPKELEKMVVFLILGPG